VGVADDNSIGGYLIPYKMRWVPAPKDEMLNVLQEIPEGLLDSLYRQYGIVEDKFVCFHKCKKCGGWIEGEPTEYHIDTLRPLSGRRGTEYYCRRCGHQIGFIGMMS
jgi:hypothetical protein